jgi:gliding motility-associated-like protein
MPQNFKAMNRFAIFFIVFFFVKGGFAQLNVEFSSTLNMNCLGAPCSYEGPSILINELMISPVANDGSISGPGQGLGRGEWIELYNPNLCEPVDISCYYLGNYTNIGSSNGQGGVRLPDNLIVPPGGFVMVRGINVAPVPANLLVANGGNVLEVVVPADVWDDGACSTSERVWFPNVGGWFAFYDVDGVCQDAVSWGLQSGIEFAPCSASSAACPNTVPLPSYNDIPDDRKNYASTSNASNHVGNSIRRLPDGGPWSGNGAPTYATCNALPCATVGESTCTGTATINVTGGTAPYTYLWNDSQLQMTQTAITLCQGTYEVTVTDANGLTGVFEVAIENFVPTVTLDVTNAYCVYDDAVNLVNFSPAAYPNEFGEITGNGINGFVFNPEIAGVGTHTITYTFIDSMGCENSAENQIIVHPIPDLTLNIANEYCDYDPVVILSNFSPSATGPGTGTFSGSGISGFSFNPGTAGQGTHTITYNYTSQFGCENTITDEIVVHAAPIVNFSGTPTVGFEPLVVEFTNNSTGASLYNWNYGDGSTALGNFTESQHTFLNFGTYTVTVYAEENGCTDQMSMTIQVNINPITYEIPNVFSPNGDDANPFFVLIDPIGFKRIDAFEVLILNRWGQLIRTFVDYDFAWDGTDESGNPVTEGVYFYKLYILSSQGETFENHGFVHLVRE